MAMDGRLNCLVEAYESQQVDHIMRRGRASLKTGTVVEWFGE